LVLLALAQIGACVSTAMGSQSRKARDLYTNYDGAQQGRPGVKVSIRLMRDGKERRASLDEEFYSGDRIKLSLETNFTGYVAVVNTGPTGHQTLLYPQADDAVFPAGGATLPPAEDKWIVFDDTTGDERLALIFSASPLQLHAQQAGRRPSTATPPQQTSQQQSGGDESAGGPAEGQDALSALAELNSRAITRGRDRAASRDMSTETIGADTYTVVSHDALTDPVGVEFVLRHAKR
jgi:hypothetical protein